MPLNKNLKTAVLIFANSSQEEAKQKGIPQSKKLFDVLTEQTLRTVAKSQLPYFHFSENQQVGDTFGERFTNAIDVIFQKGFDFVITIGNDTPHLKVSHILETEKRLQSNSFVLGPSTDGGFYLMGLNRSQFECTNFNILKWQTSSLQKQLLYQISKTSTTIFRLEYLCDIDDVKDIHSFLNFAHDFYEKIRCVLLQTLNSGKILLKLRLSYYSFSYSSSYYNKGSPVALHI